MITLIKAVKGEMGIYLLNLVNVQEILGLLCRRLVQSYLPIVIFPGLNLLSVREVSVGVGGGV